MFLDTRVIEFMASLPSRRDGFNVYINMKMKLLVKRLAYFGYFLLVNLITVNCET
jgi:hypothetical protein